MDLMKLFNESQLDAPETGNADFKVKTADFPESPAISGTEITVTEPAMLLADLAQCAKYASIDDSRKALTGILLQGRDKLTLAATDGKRLTTAETAGFVSAGSRSLEDHPVIIPAGVVAALSAFFRKRKTLLITVGEKWMKISCDDGEFSFRLIDAEFPNYRQVIPPSYTNRIRLSGFALGWGINMLGASRDQVNCTLAIGKNAVNLSYSSALGYTSTAAIPAETLDVDGGEISFNYQFLGQLAKLGEEIEMTWNDSANPVMLTTGRYTCVIMPIRNR